MSVVYDKISRALDRQLKRYLNCEAKKENKSQDGSVLEIELEI